MGISRPFFGNYDIAGAVGYGSLLGNNDIAVVAGTESYALAGSSFTDPGSFDLAAIFGDSLDYVRPRRQLLVRNIAKPVLMVGVGFQGKGEPADVTVATDRFVQERAADQWGQDGAKPTDRVLWRVQFAVSNPF